MRNIVWRCTLYGYGNISLESELSLHGFPRGGLWCVLSNEHETNGAPPDRRTYVVNILLVTTITTKCNMRWDWRRNWFWRNRISHHDWFSRLIFFFWIVCRWFEHESSSPSPSCSLKSYNKHKPVFSVFAVFTCRYNL